MESLPTEMVEEILGFLDSDSMKMASSLNKDWRNFIFNSQKLMNRFTLKVHNIDEQKSFLVNFGTSFRKVRATADLSLENGNPSYNQKNLVDFLKLVRNVETLEIGKIKMTFRTKNAIEMNLPKLKNLKLCNLSNTYRVSNFLGSIKLQELSMDVEKTCKTVCFDEDFLNWLCDQDQLKSLSFQGLSLNAFLLRMETNLHRIKFKLKKLYLKVDGIKVEAICDALINFLNQQNEVEELILDKDDHRTNANLCSRIIQQVLRTSNNLRHLEILGIVDFNLEDIEGLKKRSLETLIFKTSANNQAYQLIRLAPNLKCLEIKIGWSFARNVLKTFLIFISAYAPKLEVLRITKSYLYQEEYYYNMRLPHLKELSLVSSSINYANWKSIVEKCPKIEKIHLEYFVFSTNSLFLICQRLKNFKTLDLGCGVYHPRLLEPLGTCPQFRRLIISPEMRNQFNNILANASFEVSVKQNQNQTDTHGGRFNSFRIHNKQLTDFVGYSENFADFANEEV